MSAPIVSAEWSADAIERLRIMWDAGLSASEIARREGRSKNSIVGKAHRLHLTPRPSPIREKGSRNNRRRIIISLPHLSSLSSLLLDDPILLTAPPRERPAPKPKPKPIAEAPRVVRESNLRCEWRDGDKPCVVRCGHKTVFGYPYCAEHCNTAYINWRGAMAEAA